MQASVHQSYWKAQQTGRTAECNCVNWLSCLICVFSVLGVDAAIPAYFMDQRIEELTTLDLPGFAIGTNDAFTFTFISAPKGMTLNPTNGALRWTPTEEQGPSTNPVIILLSDTRDPAKSITNTFTP